MLRTAISRAVAFRFHRWIRLNLHISSVRRPSKAVFFLANADFGLVGKFHVT